MQAVFIVMPVFILIAAGWCLRQKNWLSPQTIKENNFFLYWFAIPATLLRGILSADTGVLQSVSFLAAVWLPYFVMFAAVWFGARRENSARFPAIMLCSMRGNHFFAGLPIVTLAMGQRGTEAGTLILAFTLVLMQMLSIGGAQLASIGTLSWKAVKAVLLQLSKNPLFITCLLGLALVSAGLNRLPAWLDATLSILADVSTGLALVGLGAEIVLRNLLKTAASVWKIILFKLVLFPVVTYAISICFALPADIVQAGVLLAGMPVAVNSAILGQEMGMDGAFCGVAVAVTTLFSLITLPLIIRLLGIA